MDVENGAPGILLVENLEYVHYLPNRDKIMVFIRSTSLWSVIAINIPVPFIYFDSYCPE